MKYICLGYVEPGTFESMSESERNTVLDECFSYNDELRKNGHLIAEECVHRLPQTRRRCRRVENHGREPVQ